MSLKKILDGIRDEILRKDEVRQEIQMAARKITRLSKQAIFLAHREKADKAESLLKEASARIDKLNEMLKIHPNLSCSGIADSAFEEYSEAQIYLNLIRNGRFIDPREMGVPSECYVLGLADVIGELRRRSLDLIRRGRVEAAEETLNLMETMYTEIISHDELLLLIPGLRRKCDVARRIIESTRGDITTEVRRMVLNNAMKELEKALKSKIK